MRNRSHEGELDTNRTNVPLDLARFPASLRFLDALRPWNSEQVVADDEQIGQRAGDEEAVRVLRDAAVAHLEETEDALDDADRMLNPGADSGARPVDEAVVWSTRIAPFFRPVRTPLSP